MAEDTRNKQRWKDFEARMESRIAGFETKLIAGIESAIDAKLEEKLGVFAELGEKLDRYFDHNSLEVQAAREDSRAAREESKATEFAEKFDRASMVENTRSRQWEWEARIEAKLTGDAQEIRRTFTGEVESDGKGSSTAIQSGQRRVHNSSFWSSATAVTELYGSSTAGYFRTSGSRQETSTGTVNDGSVNTWEKFEQSSTPYSSEDSVLTVSSSGKSDLTTFHMTERFGELLFDKLDNWDKGSASSLNRNAGEFMVFMDKDSEGRDFVSDEGDNQNVLGDLVNVSEHDTCFDPGIDGFIMAVIESMNCDGGDIRNCSDFDVLEISVDIVEHVGWIVCFDPGIGEELDQGSSRYDTLGEIDVSSVNEMNVVDPYYLENVDKSVLKSARLFECSEVAEFKSVECGSESVMCYDPGILEYVSVLFVKEMDNSSDSCILVTDGDNMDENYAESGIVSSLSTVFDEELEDKDHCTYNCPLNNDASSEFGTSLRCYDSGSIGEFYMSLYKDRNLGNLEQHGDVFESSLVRNRDMFLPCVKLITCYKGRINIWHLGLILQKSDPSCRVLREWFEDCSSLFMDSANCFDPDIFRSYFGCSSSLIRMRDIRVLQSTFQKLAERHHNGEFEWRIIQWMTNDSEQKINSILELKFESELDQRDMKLFEPFKVLSWLIVENMVLFLELLLHHGATILMKTLKFGAAVQRRNGTLTRRRGIQEGKNAVQQKGMVKHGVHSVLQWLIAWNNSVFIHVGNAMLPAPWLVRVRCCILPCLYVSMITVAADSREFHCILVELKEKNSRLLNKLAQLKTMFGVSENQLRECFVSSVFYFVFHELEVKLKDNREGMPSIGSKKLPFSSAITEVQALKLPSTGSKKLPFSSAITEVQALKLSFDKCLIMCASEDESKGVCAVVFFAVNGEIGDSLQYLAFVAMKNIHGVQRTKIGTNAKKPYKDLVKGTSVVYMTRSVFHKHAILRSLEGKLTGFFVMPTLCIIGLHILGKFLLFLLLLPDGRVHLGATVLLISLEFIAVIQKGHIIKVNSSASRLRGHLVLQISSFHSGLESEARFKDFRRTISEMRLDLCQKEMQLSGSGQKDISMNIRMIWWIGNYI